MAPYSKQDMLSGTRVLDLTRVLAGPLCTMILGDMGADVLKVERPGTGDATRGWGPPFDDRGESAYFLSVNRNKLSVTADMSRRADVAMLRALMAEADVVVENFRPGTLARAGLGGQAMCRAHPGLVWCTIQGFSADAERPGYDFVVQADCGWMSITGEPTGAPMKHGVALADVLAGKDAALSVVAALVARARTGVGRRLVVSLDRSAEAALVNVAQNALVSGAAPVRWGNAHANLVPYQLFEARDRLLVVAVGTDVQWLACVREMGLAALAEDPSLRANAGRVAARERVVSAFAERLREEDAEEWLRRFRRVGVPSGVVRTVPEVLASTDASVLTGMPPSVPGSVRRPPPRLGEHTTLVSAHGWGAFALG